MKVNCAYDALVPLSQLRQHPKNRNKHPKAQIERLAKILEYQGWRSPIKVSNRSGYITAGHGRLMAAIKNNYTEVPVDYQDYDTEDQEYADVQADNAIASWAELDLSGINLDISELGPDFNIDLLGIKNFKIDISEKANQDEVPEPKKEAITKLGDLWILGNHRLLCGDSTNVQHVDRLLDGKKADICFTSPPYNLGDNAKLRGYNGDGKDSAYIEKSDHKTNDEYLNFLSAFTSNCLIAAKTSFINIQILAGNKYVIPQYWNLFSKQLIDLMVWDKEHAQPSAAPRVLNSVWEFIFIFSDQENHTRALDSGPYFRGTIDNIYRLNPVGKKDPLAKDHGACFPVQFVEYFITKFSDGDVFDPFTGSGSTLIACEKTNRKCFMMEIDPIYCDVIVARWERFTGKKAELSNASG